MKAKEYAKMLEANPTEQTLGEIAIGFMKEIYEIAEKRGCKQPSAIASVLDSQREKWRAFHRLAKYAIPEREVVEDGFERLIKKQAPGLYLAWKQHNPRIK